MLALLVLAIGASRAPPAMAADCPAKPADQAIVLPMPELKAKEPMPTGMAKPGTMKQDVTIAAALQGPCMDVMLQQDQQAVDKKPAN